MRKILLATSTFNLRGGGISSYAVDFCRQLNKNYCIYVVSSDLIDPELKYLFKESFQINSNDLSLSNIKKTLSLINELEPDIIVNSNFRVFSIVVPYISKRIKRVSISHFIDGQLAKVAGFNFNYYDTIVALSQHGKIFLEDYYGITNRSLVRVVYNFFDNNFLENAMDTLENNNELLITYPGGANLHKNPLLVLKIVKLLLATNIKFKLFWLGDTQLPGGRFLAKEDISDLISPDSRLVFTGKLARKEVLKIIGETNIFLLPSLKEGCPISLMEALSLGVIPVVSDSKHASSEILTNYLNGFILPENEPEPYVNLILDIIRNHANYKQFYIESKKLHMNKLTGKIWSYEMEKLFKEKNNNLFSENTMSDWNVSIKKWKFQYILTHQRIMEYWKSIRMYFLFKSEKLFHK